MEPINPESLDSFDRAALHPGLTTSEKEIRDKFVAQYLLDYDPIAACIRIGYMKSFAEDYSHKFMAEPYVQQRIKDAELADGVETDADRDKKQVMSILRREAQYRGAGSSHAARVTAAMHWAKLLGMEPATKTQSEVKVTTPVQFYLPSNGRDPQTAPTVTSPEAS